MRYDLACVDLRIIWANGTSVREYIIMVCMVHPLLTVCSNLALTLQNSPCALAATFDDRELFTVSEKHTELIACSDKEKCRETRNKAERQQRQR